MHFKSVLAQLKSQIFQRIHEFNKPFSKLAMNLLNELKTLIISINKSSLLI